MRKISLCFLFIFSIQKVAGQLKECPYELEPKKEFAYLGAGLVLSSAALILNKNLAQLTLAEIDQLDPTSIPKVDRNAIYNYSSRAADRSDQLQLTGWLMPFAFAIPKNSQKDFWTIGLLSVETMLITQGITGIFKGSIQRVRPFVYNENVSIEDKMDIKAKRSFFSGHTSNYATLSFFTAKVISDYSLNRSVKIVVWSLASASSAYMGHLRVKAGKHFTTDVIAGYVVGAAIGIAVPQLHKKGLNKKLSIAPNYNFETTGLNLTWYISR